MTHTSSVRLVRPTFIPGVLAAIVLLAGLALIGTDYSTPVLYVVCILALIMVVMVVQARRIFWAIPLIAVAAVWNPVLPLDIPETPFRMLHIVAAAVLLAVGIFMRVPEATERSVVTEEDEDR